MTASTISILRPLTVPNMIRVAQFDRTEYLSSKTLRCKLQYMELNARNYGTMPNIAISYAWSAEPGNRVMECNGIDLPVTQSVYSAIERTLAFMWNRRPDIATLYLWADQLCVLQGLTPDALAERASQVKLMSRIYSGAGMVMIDLGGPLPQEFTNLMSILKALKSSTYDTGEYMKSFLSSMYSQGYSERSAWLVMCHAVSHLTSRLWFSRLWIAQEYVLNDIGVMLIGEEGIEAEVLLRNLTLLHQGFTEMSSDSVKHELIQSGALDGMGSPNFVFWVRLVMLWKYNLRQKGNPRDFPPVPFSKLLRWIKQQNTTDPRDKVYGCLGLAPESFRDSFLVDYNEEVDLLFLRVVVDVIRFEKKVDVLDQTLGVEAPHNQPSWTLSLLKSDRPKELVFQSRRDDNACGIYSEQLSVRRDKASLFVQGCAVDTIKDLGMDTPGRMQTLQGSDWTRYWHDLVSQKIKDTIKTINKCGLSLGDIEVYDRFWRMIMKDRFPLEPTRQVDESGPRPHRQLQSIDAGYIFCFLVRMKYPQLKIRSPYGEIISKYAKKFLWDIYPSVQDYDGTRFAVTNDLRFAIVPNASRIGDCIAILAGGERPFVLRPTAQGFRLVGSSHLQGVMDGEYFNTPPRIALQELKIC